MQTRGMQRDLEEALARSRVETSTTAQQVLFDGVRRGDADTVRAALAAGASADALHRIGLSALHIAAQLGRVDVVRVLLAEGRANRHVLSTTDGADAAAYAIFFHHGACAVALLDRSYAANKVCFDQGSHVALAAARQQWDVVAHLRGLGYAVIGLAQGALSDADYAEAAAHLH